MRSTQKSKKKKKKKTFQVDNGLKKIQSNIKFLIALSSNYSKKINLPYLKNAYRSNTAARQIIFNP